MFCQASQGKLGIEQDLLLEGLDSPKLMAYYNFHVNAAVLFGAKRVRAELEAMEVLEFEMELAKVRFFEKTFLINISINQIYFSLQFHKMNVKT